MFFNRFGKRFSKLIMRNVIFTCFFILYFSFIPFLLLGVEIGDLQIIKDSNVEKIAVNTAIIDFNGEKYNLLDENSLTEFIGTIHNYSSLSGKFQ